MIASPTKAMILAAGRGCRLRPVTDTLPKPLIPVQGKPLIEHHLYNLKSAGIKDVVINLAHLSEKIKAQCGNGEKFGLNILYSEEAPPGLETGGGIVKALPLLGDKPFWVINGDIFTDFDFSHTPALNEKKVHVILVPNPAHNKEGDFELINGDVQLKTSGAPYTFSGIALYKPDFFEGNTIERYSVTPLLKDAIAKGLVSGECYTGTWHDVGTLERLKAANAA